MLVIFHMARANEWRDAQASGSYPGSAEDIADGFIHFSTAEQIRESAAKHRSGEAELVLVACDPERLGSRLKWEEARGGQSFPHLYGEIPMSAVLWTLPLPLDENGFHVFPELL